MYLKSIEVQGFKSFANRIVFKFENGITGIVGPNGSGKSNVADAVRWVLGEQKIKQLRGASMQDVIFAGTELRKPVGYAYVAITLDNSDHVLPIDFDEVTVARRLYRSGESEYLINNSPCRLRDVYELFYDTGIGKEGYSIIGQGQIDAILSGKPEERRELFDEAAGIVKFKRRKAASEKKLEHEQANLVRLSDILRELEKQLGPLERQSEKAKVYLKKREDLKKLDVNMFLLDHKRSVDTLNEVSKNKEIAEKQLEEATASFETAKSEYSAVESEISALSESIEADRTFLSEAGINREKLSGQITLLREKNSALTGNEEHLYSRLKSVQSLIDLQNADMESLDKAKEQFEKQLHEVEASWKVAKENLDNIRSNTEEQNRALEEAKNFILELLGLRAEIKARSSRFDTMLEQTEIRKAELTSKILQARTEGEETDRLIEELERNFEEVNESLRKDNEAQASMELRLSEIRTVLTDKDKELRELRDRYQQQKSRLDALKNIAERYEGYGSSVRMVMDRKKDTRGVIGVVADLLQVDRKYETAIEVALGANVQNIVTENEDTAREMIEYLKRNKGGRCTFLPLDGIDHPKEFENEEVLEEKGVLGLADSLVTVDKKYRNVTRTLLGRIVVVDTAEHALAIARKYKHTIRMVTLEGEYLTPGGAISGGAYKNNSNLLGRTRELDKLEKEAEALQEQYRSLEQEIADIREERNTLRAKTETLRLTIQNSLLQQNTIRISLEGARDKKKESSLGESDLQKEQEAIEAAFAEIRDGRASIETDLEKSTAQEEEKKAEIERIQELLLTLREKESVASSEVSAWDVQIEKLRQQQEFDQKNVSRVEEELKRYEAEKKEIEETLQKGKEDVALNEADIAEIQKTIDASYDLQSEAEERVKTNIDKREKLSERQKTFFERREAISSTMSELDKEIYRLTSQKDRLEESIDFLISYMWDEYQITLSDASLMRDDTMTDLAAIKRMISGVKEEIKALGPVNVNAIEEFKEVSERYTFMKTQHDDIQAAQKVLEDVIADLDENMRKQFLQKFAEIGVEFDHVFKELFGGGKCTIALTDDEDVLEAGILINAQPPGKKLQNMMQLSGGEKALTAIALLFAIQNLKPSPFCLLDEIEAALDESNVGRFAKYLHKLTKNTQFIVITHRRGTMEKADRLYGITMQEKGVSALVSVDLIDKQLDA